MEIIRIARKGDLKDVLRLFKLLDKKHSIKRIDFKSQIDINRYKSVLQKSFQDKTYAIFVASVNDEIVGFSIGKVYTIKNNFILKDHTVGEILFICIDDKFKRKGISKKLILELELSLQSLGASKIEINVFELNAEMFPEKMGFKKKSTVYEKFIQKLNS